jgi:hypothetical protein
MKETPAPAHPADSSAQPKREGWFRRWTRRAWWFHSFFALSFGVGVMLFARKGLAYAEHIFMVLGISWLLMFVALRFIVGPANRSADERLARKGVRLVTNYIIKQLYQQMFFFLVPIYASSATWSLSSFNWVLAPLLLVCAVVSTLDLVFDNVIMERRFVASAMYGLALFGVLNLLLPIVFGVRHFPALLVAAAATAPAVAMLSFRVRSVFSGTGLAITTLVTGALLAGAWFGRGFIPPVPLAMVDGAVGHGSEGSYECLPGKKKSMQADQLDRLRCGSEVVEPGGLSDKIVHVWTHKGRSWRVEPRAVSGCKGHVVRSYFPQSELAKIADRRGKWACAVKTSDGQLVGLLSFRVTGPSAPPTAAPTPTTRSDGGPEQSKDRGGSRVMMDAGPHDAGAAADAAPTNTTGSTDAGVPVP